MLHYNIAEDAAAVAAHRKTTKWDVLDVAGALLVLLTSTVVFSGILLFI